MANLSSFVGGAGTFSSKPVLMSSTPLTNSGTTTVPAGTYTIGTFTGSGVVTHLIINPTFFTLDYDNILLRFEIDGVTTELGASTWSSTVTTQFSTGISGNTWARGSGGLYIPFTSSFSYKFRIASNLTNGRSDWYIAGSAFGCLKN